MQRHNKLAQCPWPLLLLLASCSLAGHTKGTDKTSSSLDLPQVALSYTSTDPGNLFCLDSFQLRNQTATTFEFYGDRADWPLISREILSDTGWSGTVRSFCGTGLTWWRIGPGENLTFQTYALQSKPMYSDRAPGLPPREAIEFQGETRIGLRIRNVDSQASQVIWSQGYKSLWQDDPDSDPPPVTLEEMVDYLEALPQ